VTGIWVDIASDPSAHDRQALREALFAYNRSQAGDQHFQELTAARRPATDRGWADWEYVLGMASSRVPVGRRKDSGPRLRPAAPHDPRG